jgi:hypothetical protein
MMTMIPTDGVHDRAEGVLVTKDAPQASDLAVRTETTALAEYSFAALDQEVRAARLQIIRGTQEFVEGHLRLAIALSIIRANRLYLDGGYNSYEEYLDRCQGISLDTAQRCVETFAAFGPDGFRDLVANLGLTRSYFLALINNIAPQVIEDLLELPQIDGAYAVAMLDSGEWQQVYNELKAQLEEAYTRHDELADKLAAAQQISAAFKSRFDEQVKINQNLTVAHDQAEREVERLGKDIAGKPRRDPKKERELKQQVKRLEEQLAATQAALDLATATPATSVSAPPPTTEDDVVTYDPALIVEHLRFCVTALRRYREMAPHLEPDAGHDLHRAIAEVIEQADVALLIPTMRACAAALSTYPPGSPNIPTAHTRAFYLALRALGVAVATAYPAEEAHARA